MSVQNFLLKKFLRHYYKPRFTHELALEDARKELDCILNDYMPPPCTSLHIRDEEYGEIECEVISHKVRDLKGTFFYVHGGGFAMGSPESHRGVTCEIAKEQLYKLIIPKYRLAPEHTYPAADEDLMKAWLSVVDDPEIEKPIILGGDQSGAFLAFQLLLELRDKALALPDIFVGLSGLYDLNLTAESLETNKESDCVNQICVFERGINYYIPEHMHLSEHFQAPFDTSLTGLPPVLLHASDSEILADDSKRLANAIAEQGGVVEVEFWEDVPSCWHIAAIGLPEGRAAIKKIAAFVKDNS